MDRRNYEGLNYEGLSFAKDVLTTNNYEGLSFAKDVTTKDFPSQKMRVV